MREIKFRAWDDARKEMIEDFQYFKSGDENADWIIPKHKVWEDIEGDNYTVDMSKYPHMRQQFEIMQYTGLKDRNGKEIYEGDIVRRDWVEIFPGREDFTGIVKYVEGSFCIEDIEDPYSGDSLFIEIGTNEVVGNIYENPDLLEGGTPE